MRAHTYGVLFIPAGWEVNVRGVVRRKALSSGEDAPSNLSYQPRSIPAFWVAALINMGGASRFYVPSGCRKPRQSVLGWGCGRAITGMR